MRHVLFITAVVLVAGCLGFGGADQEMSVSENTTEEFVNDQPDIVQTDTVAITENGFEPQIIEVSQGTPVIFLNVDDEPHRVASNTHPTHTEYPGTTADDCGNEEAFDSCQNIEPGTDWTFVFWEEGEWGYHDHLNPEFNGTVIVD